jgi:hypothetical protein
MRRFLHIVAIGGLVALALSAAVTAQAPAPPPKPGPEIQKLAYFVGSWKYEGETKPGDFGPAGKFTGEETCDWFTGGFQVVCHSTEASVIGKSTGMSVMAYNAEDKIYTFYSISSRGENFHGSATFTGSTMTITWEGNMGGKPAKVRGTIMQASPTSYTFKMEGSTGGGPWVTVGEGKETKVK